MILKGILGGKCQDIIDIFTEQEIDAEAFYSVDKDILVELGMQAFVIFLLLMYFFSQLCMYVGMY